jgi:hypothetical protein
MRSANGWYAVVGGPAHVPSPAAFREPKSPVLAHASLGEKTSARARSGNLEVDLEGVPSKVEGEPVTVARVRVGGRVVATERFEGGLAPNGDARIVQLDPSSALPQVVLSHFTGGAHCCTETRDRHVKRGDTMARDRCRQDGRRRICFGRY